MATKQTSSGAKSTTKAKTTLPSTFAWPPATTVSASKAQVQAAKTSVATAKPLPVVNITPQVTQTTSGGGTTNKGQEIKISKTDELGDVLNTVPRVPESQPTATTPAQQAKIALLDQSGNGINTVSSPTNTTWTEAAIQADASEWYRDRYKKDSEGNLLYKNYADYAMQKYGSGAPGLPSEASMGLGPRTPANVPEQSNADKQESGVAKPAPYSTGTGQAQTEEEEPLEIPASGPGEPNWSEQYHVPGAPDWWRGMVADQNDPELEYAVLMNAMIPFLSSEDQRAVATNLATLYPEVFGMYSAVGGAFASPASLTGESSTSRRVNTQTSAIPYLGSQYSDKFTRNAFSQERANEILNTLNTVKSKVGKEMGPGFTYLQQLASAVRDFGGKNNNLPTRSQLTQLMGALDPLIAESTGNNSSISAFGPLSKMLSTPFMSAGSVLPVTKNTTTGEYSFGTPNKSLY